VQVQEHVAEDDEDALAVVWNADAKDRFLDLRIQTEFLSLFQHGVYAAINERGSSNSPFSRRTADPR